MPQRRRTPKNASAKKTNSSKKKKSVKKSVTRNAKTTTNTRSQSSKKAKTKSAAKAHSRDRVAGAMSDEESRAALDASDKLYYRIGEVSELTAVKAHVLRYWETEFRWMAPPKSRSKQRLYRKRDIEFVWLLKRLLWDERYTIAGARQRIQELGVDQALELLSQPIGQAPSQTRGESSDSAAAIDLESFRQSLGSMKSEILALRESLAASA